VKAYPTKGFRKFLWGGKSAVMAEKPKLLPYKFNADAGDVGVSSHSRPLLNTGRITAGNARRRGISES
jgi:hypothetical protein